MDARKFRAEDVGTLGHAGASGNAVPYNANVQVNAEDSWVNVRVRVVRCLTRSSDCSS